MYSACSLTLLIHPANATHNASFNNHNCLMCQWIELLNMSFVSDDNSDRDNVEYTSSQTGTVLNTYHPKDHSSQGQYPTLPMNVTTWDVF